MLRTELHCHNIYSNGHVGELEPPCDCNVTISEQLQKSLDSKLDVLFVTNHNTLDGFSQTMKNSQIWKSFLLKKLLQTKKHMFWCMGYKKKSNHTKQLMKLLMQQNPKML